MIMEDDVFEAEIAPASGDNTLNITLAATLAISIAFLFLGTSIGQLLEQEQVIDKSYEWWEIPLHERHKMDLNLTQERSV